MIQKMSLFVLKVAGLLCRLRPCWMYGLYREIEQILVSD